MTDRDFPVSSIEDPLRVLGKHFRSGDQSVFLKAVTFGPFPAGAFPDEGMAQLERIRNELGANAIRMYEIPTLEFLHECARIGLRVFITLPWSQHVDFLRGGGELAEADELLIETIERFRGHPALAGYFVANEIETTLVRWMGRRKVREQLERLIEVGRANDPDALFSYANYPSTEYLIPGNQDFLSFNIYLEQREDFAAYLNRLQNLAGNKPLLVSEFGVDARTHGELTQAEMLEWQVEETCLSGAAGTTIFSWTDLWQRGGQTIEDYDFGFMRRDGTLRPSLDVVRECWEPLSRTSDVVELAEGPKLSVIVCTYKGSATLVECLDSLTTLDYPDYEVLVVNDGSDDRVSEIVATYDSIREIKIDHVGLSAARNVGAKEAKGEVFVYTDDDCIAEADWLTWIAKQFLEDPELGCAGGPNIPPAPESEMQARIIAAPGGPSHVLISDTRAEHLPGCNMAVRREVFEEVGGFNPIFWAAGDDVDFCWRVLEAGYELGFHAAAFIWHHRRFTPRAYLKQQIGYGKAEAMLLPLHSKRFRGLGGAVWSGHVYTPQAPGGGFVYHGHFGYEPFQLIYPDSGSGLGGVVLHVLWWVCVVIAVVCGFFHWSGWLLAGLMLYTTFRVARKRAKRAPVQREYDGFAARWTLTGLIVAQGFLRSGVRLLRGWKYAKWSRGLEVVTTSAWKKVASGWWKLGDEKAFWSENGIGRDELLAGISAAYPEAQVDASGRTDLILKRCLLWNWALVTATEYHADNNRLTRTRLLARPRFLIRMIVLPVLLGVLVVAPFTPLLFTDAWKILLGVVSGYAALTAATRIFMKLRRPAILRIAEGLGMDPVE